MGGDGPLTEAVRFVVANCDKNVCVERDHFQYQTDFTDISATNFIFATLKSNQTGNVRAIIVALEKQ